MRMGARVHGCDYPGGEESDTHLTFWAVRLENDRSTIRQALNSHIHEMGDFQWFDLLYKPLGDSGLPKRSSVHASH